jgi:hypothetical protein
MGQSLNIELDDSTNSNILLRVAVSKIPLRTESTIHLEYKVEY